MPSTSLHVHACWKEEDDQGEAVPVCLPSSLASTADTSLLVQHFPSLLLVTCETLVSFVLQKRRRTIVCWPHTAACLEGPHFATPTCMEGQEKKSTWRHTTLLFHFSPHVGTLFASCKTCCEGDERRGSCDITCSICLASFSSKQFHSV